MGSNVGNASSTLSAVELRGRLDRKIWHLLKDHPANHPLRPPLDRQKQHGPPSGQLAEIEEVRKPTEAEVLTRCMLPLLQLTMDDPSLEHGVLDLTMEEMGTVLGSKAPELRPLLHALRVSVDAALRRRPAGGGGGSGEFEGGGSGGAAAAGGGGGGGGMEPALPSSSSSRRASPRGHTTTSTNAGAAAPLQARPPQGRPPPQARPAQPRPPQPRGGPPASAVGRPSGPDDRRRGRRSSDSDQSVGDAADDPAEAEAPPSRKAGLAYQQRMDAEEDHFIKIQEEEQAAATVLQRHRRGVQRKRAMPEVRRQIELKRIQHAAATRLQAVARGWLYRTMPIRAFRLAHFARVLQRAERARQRHHLRVAMLHDHSSLSPAAVDKALAARDAFLLLERPARTALLPSLLAMLSGTVETLTQAGDLWAGMPPHARANAVVAYVHACEPPERQQVLRLVVQAVGTEELMGLLKHIASHSGHWGIGQSELLQRLLAMLHADDPKSQHAAKFSEDKLVSGLVEALPAESVAKQLQKLALYSHLPPIRSKLPQKEKPPFERIPQAANPPPRSYRDVLNGPVGGGVFGPPPVNDKALLPTPNIVAPPGIAFKPPELSPRVPRDPRQLERAMANRRQEGGAAAPSESLFHPPPPRGLGGGGGPPSSRASRGTGAHAAAPRATPTTGVTNVPSWLQQ